jgi:protease-4
MDNDFPPPNPPPTNPAPQPASVPPPPPPLPPLLPPPVAPRKPRTGSGWKIATFVLAGLLLLTLFGTFVSSFFQIFTTMETVPGESRLTEVTLERNRAADKIAVIPVEGIISGSGFDGSGYNMVRLIEDQLKLAGKDERVRAVLLKVNSPGGEVLASDDIYNAIIKFQNEHNKPVVASMGSLAASGGYYVSAPCRWIVANELTITGSIGVIMHGYNYRGLMNKVGLRPMVFKSGRFKDMLSGERDLEKLTPAEKADVEEEEAMIAKMINETYEKFKSIVAEGRKFSSNRNQSNQGDEKDKGRPLSTKWTALADGRILSGKEAYEQGFVDEVGNWRTAIRRAQKLAGIDRADLVTYQMPFSLGNLLGIFGKSDAKSVKVDLGFDLPKLNAGLYYLCPTFLR